MITKNHEHVFLKATRADNNSNICRMNGRETLL